MILLLFLTLAGIGLLYTGGEFLVRGASGLALRWGLSPLVVGLTVVAFGTSAPELVVSVRAALANAGDIAIGGVVGSNIANVGLILAIAVLVRPIRVEPQLVRADIPLSIGAMLLATALLIDGALNRVEGGLLLAGLIGYLIFTFRSGDRRASFTSDSPVAQRQTKSLGANSVLTGAGFLLLALGAESLLRGGTGLAEQLGVPAAVVGLTVVAVGTSLPELATSTVAAVRGQGDLALGNVVGSSLFNVLGILGISALVRPISALGLEVPDLAAMVCASALLLPFAMTRRTINRLEGISLLVLYLGYVLYLLAR